VLVFTANHFSVGCDVPVDSETFLVTDFMNLKIKLAQSFRGAHRGRVCVRVFIGVNVHTRMSIFVYTVFLKKSKIKFMCSYIWTMRSKLNGSSPNEVAPNLYLRAIFKYRTEFTEL
jgi:hypothetical protein